MTYSNKLRDVWKLDPKMIKRKPAPTTPPPNPEKWVPPKSSGAPEFSLVSLIDRFMYSTQHSRSEGLGKKHTPEPRVQGVFHPSEICKEVVCDRALVYELMYAPMNEVQHDAKLLRIFDNGHSVHDRLQTVLELAAEWDGGFFKRELPIWDEKLRIKGTTDGCLVLDKHSYLVEIKSMNSNNFRKLKDGYKIEHFDQLNTYMYVTGVHQAFILVENKDNQDLKDFFVRFDPERLAVNPLPRITRGLEHLHLKTLPPQDDDACEEQQCKFYSVCRGSAQDTWQPE